MYVKQPWMAALRCRIPQIDRTGMEMPWQETRARGCWDADQVSGAHKVSIKTLNSMGGEALVCDVHSKVLLKEWGEEARMASSRMPRGPNRRPEWQQESKTHSKVAAR